MKMESYHMSWGSHAENTRNILTSLLNKSTFADVTLVCDDGKMIKAHKAILSESSSLLGGIIKNITHPHPVIYLSEVDSNDLQAILELVYVGKTDVIHDNLENFIKTADKLKIVGLTENVDLSVNDQKKKPNSGSQSLPILEKERNISGQEKKLVKSNIFWQPHLDNNDPKLPTRRCKRCPYETYSKDVLDVHLRDFHNLVFTCDKCSFKGPTPESLKHHQKKCNIPDLFCTKCGSKYKNQDALDRHDKVCKTPPMSRSL